MANTIRSRFGTEIEDVESIFVLYDNAPVENIPDPDPGTLWVRLAFLPGRTLHVENGGPTSRYRTIGIARATIFHTLEEGDADALNLADKIVTAFRSITVSMISFQSPMVNHIGRSGPWWQTNVDCPFRADVQA
jgi:hypothetical protein